MVGTLYFHLDFISFFFSSFIHIISNIFGYVCVDIYLIAANLMMMITTV